ncbi:protogenin B-like isoform X2 [Cimex lectularius]|uniref:Uncharacterized protein n=1 Tax=Cimex lectularius TaxID=79782 RepID=A0A8I6RW57_CIMLE|nr:protogenin B-like isoform X2 [Cimex lectularius]
MAARVLFIGIACTVGLIAGETIGLELGIEEGGEGEVVGVKNHALHLPCRPTSPASVIWTHDGQQVYNDSRRFTAENGSLIITKVVHKRKGESDRGVYQCTVRNNFGAIISSPIKVIIAALAHEFSENPANTTIKEGEVLKLTCSIESSPPAKITWLRDDKPLPQNRRFILLDSGSLYIANIKKDDSGLYRCQATNAYIKKSRVSTGAEVVVDSFGNSGPHPVKFLNSSPPNNLTLREGTKTSIVCAVSGTPRPNLKWIKTKGFNSTRENGLNGNLITSNNGLIVLQIDKVTAEHAGSYSCVASHKFKDKTAVYKKVVNVVIQTAPTIVEAPKSQMYPAAKTVRIECEVRGLPNPKVIWYKNGKELNINGRIKQNSKELVLGGTVSQDTGIYQCFATSPAGVAWRAGRLVVNTSSDQPNPPTNLTCMTISPTQVNLSWAQEQQTDFKAFTVHYFPTEGGDELKEVAKNETFIVSKLQPFTNYTFYVRSYGKAASELSGSVFCKTGEAMPTGGPKVVASVTPYCIHVTWSPPPSSEARGSITEYKIQWKRANQSSTNFEKVPGTIKQYTIRDVIQNQEYMVRVIGATSLGWPDLSEDQAPWIRIKIPKHSSNPFPPPTMRLIAVNDTTIHVEWTYPEGIDIDGFKLYYGQLNSTDRTLLVLKKNVTDFHITHLDPSTWYEVEVKAFSGDVEGESCVESKSTREKVLFAPSLPMPISLEATSPSPHSINISWSLPSHHHSWNITHYTVLYNLLYAPTHNFTGKTVQTSNTSVQITGLAANTLYEFSVRAHGYNNQVSAVSSKIECKTLQEDVVENIKWRILNSTSIQVSWKGIKSASYYSIFYSLDPSAPLNLWHQENIYKNQTSAELTGLKSNHEYSLRVRGGSSSGTGPLSANVFFTLFADIDRPSNDENHQPSGSIQSDQFLGIVVGCAISILCILLCTASLLYKRSCSKNQGQISTNGNGQCSSELEMQALTQLVSKGSFPNGQANGMKHPLIINGGIPNGIVREKGVRITENPQRLEGECGSSRTTDEGDSLLSGPDPEMDNEETHMTTIGSSFLSKELPPDDGFHETSNLTPNW